MSYLPSLSPEALAGLFLVATIAAIIQRTTGQAFGTILAGFVTLIAPAYVPAAVILLGLWISGVYLWLLPHLVRRRRRA